MPSSRSWPPPSAVPLARSATTPAEALSKLARVDPGAALEHVVAAGAAVDRVDAVAAVEPIVAGTAVDQIVPASAVDRVIAPVAEEHAARA